MIEWRRRELSDRSMLDAGTRRWPRLFNAGLRSDHGGGKLCPSEIPVGGQPLDHQSIAPWRRPWDPNAWGGSSIPVNAATAIAIGAQPLRPRCVVPCIYSQ
jgi:hypothetical protein